MNFIFILKFSLNIFELRFVPMEVTILKDPFSYKILNLRSLKFQTNLRSRRVDTESPCACFSTSFCLFYFQFPLLLFPTCHSHPASPTIRLILPSIYHSIPFPSFTSHPTKTGPSPFPLPFFSKWRRKKNARGILLSLQTRSIILSFAQIRYHNHSISISPISSVNPI